MATFGAVFLDGTNPADKDNRGRLGVALEEAIKRGTLELSKEIKDREFTSQVAEHKITVNKLLSDIQEGEMRGESTAKVETSLYDALEIGVRAGWIDASVQAAYIKDSYINRFAGQIYKTIIDAPKTKLADVQATARKLLIDRKDELTEGGKARGFDLTGADKDLILDRVNRHVNFQLHNDNLQKAEINRQRTNAVFPILMEAIKNENFNSADLEAALAKAAITKEMAAEDPLLQQFMLRLEGTVAGNEQQLNDLYNRNLFSRLSRGIKTKSDEDYQKHWDDVQRYNEFGAFNDIPEAYDRLLDLHIVRVKASIKALERGEVQDTELMFNRLAYSGWLTKEVLARLMGSGIIDEDNEERNEKLHLWLLGNQSKVKGWIETYAGGQTAVNKAIGLKLTNGGSFPPNAQGVAAAQTIIDAEIKQATNKNLKSPYDVTTEEGQTNLFVRVATDGIMNKNANNLLTTMAFNTDDVNQAFKAAVVYRGLADQRNVRGASIRQTIPAATRQRLVMLSSYFNSANGTDEAAFQKHLDVIGSKAYKDRIEAYVAKFTPDKFREYIGIKLQDASSEEWAQSFSNQLPLIWAWRKFWSPISDMPNLRRLAANDADGDPAFYAQDMAPPSAAVTDTIHGIFKNMRIHYDVSDEGSIHGDQQALEDAIGHALRTRLIGPTSFKSPMLRDGDGEWINKDEDGKVHLSLRPVEGYFDTAQQAHAVVQERVRQLIEKLPKETQDKLPPLLRKWYTRVATSVLSFGWDAGQRALGWHDIVGNGWIRMTPILHNSTNDVGQYEISLQNPADSIVDSFFNPDTRLYEKSIVIGHHENFQQKNWTDLNNENYTKSFGSETKALWSRFKQWGWGDDSEIEHEKTVEKSQVQLGVEAALEKIKKRESGK